MTVIFRKKSGTPSKFLGGLGLLTLAALHPAPVPADPPAGTAWTQTFHDEFNSTTAGSPTDPTVWIPQTTYDSIYTDPKGVGTLMPNPNFNPHGHQPAYYIPSAVTEDGNGNLALTDSYVSTPYTAPYGNYGPVNYAGAWLTSGHFEQTYGYFEARMKPDGTTGTDPGFWMLHKGIWPPEFDVAEVPCGSRISIYGTSSIGHGYAVNQGFHGSGDGGGVLNVATPPAAPFSAAFHTYAIDWEPTFVTFYLDGKATKTLTDHDLKDIPHVPMYLILSNEMEVDDGSWWGDPAQGKYPATTLVDWVRAWQHTAREQPFGGVPAKLPGTVPAANYDDGGQGLSYSSLQNAGSYSTFRPEDLVGIKASTDTGGGNEVGWTAPGQYLKYTVNAATSGQYAVTFRVAAGSPGGSFHLENVAGKNLTGPVSVPSTGGDETWGTTAPVTLTLKAGIKTLTLVEDTGGYSLRSMTFEHKAGAPLYGVSKTKRGSHGRVAHAVAVRP